MFASCDNHRTSPTAMKCNQLQVIVSVGARLEAARLHALELTLCLRQVKSFRLLYTRADARDMKRPVRGPTNGPRLQEKTLSQLLLPTQTVSCVLLQGDTVPVVQTVQRCWFVDLSGQK